MNVCIDVDIVDNCKFYVNNYTLSENLAAPIINLVCTECKSGYYALFENSEGKAHINDK